ncbi:transcription termination factor NusA [Candidatus Aerophobetes bacterium]|uniref:Transcription termination/antitermination protein NusA n=1 Tax=Aerophobetes bacterium TaxID=2030807 RepID=A0A2A4X227_UNCAE|nr:MAG: transcription termination factor NusA [Candidatus Aerophobetes bacterium]
MKKDLLAIFEYLEREKGIKREIIIDAIEEALVIAARKSITGAPTLSVSISSKTGSIEVLAEKEIVEEVTYQDEEITLEDAQELDPAAQLGQWLKVIIHPENFGRIAAQLAKQVIAQKIRTAERDVIYNEYRDRIHDLISGTVKRIVRRGTLIVDLGKVEAILPEKFYSREENYNVGDRVQCLLWEVQDTENGGAEVILTRGHAEFVEKLFDQEVPELNEGVVSIKKIVREPGYKTKMMVASTDPRVDPLGACVGVRGTRVKNVIRELNNEKIDIVIAVNDPVQLLESLLYPIQAKKLTYNSEDGIMNIVVEDEDYPIVIGKRGMNTRLNARLIDLEIVVKKNTEYQRELNFERQQMNLNTDDDLDVSIETIKDLNSLVKDSLTEHGLTTLRSLMNTSSEELAKKTDMSMEIIEDIKEKIRKLRT